jgi:soluble lytic murein transglycosylase
VTRRPKILAALAGIAVGFLVGRALPRRGSSLSEDVAPDLSRLSTRIDAAAGEAGVDPDLLRGLVAAESGGDASARSRAGAVGLLQLMPETAGEVGRRLGMRPPFDLEDPATNLRLGAHHFARLLRELGDEGLAVAAYNAGLQPVLRWRLRAPDVDGPSAVRREGYPETRHHVRRTLRFRDVYHDRRARG